MGEHNARIKGFGIHKREFTLRGIRIDVYLPTDEETQHAPVLPGTQNALATLADNYV